MLCGDIVYLLIENIIPRPLHSWYTMGDESRKYATEPDSIVVRALCAISGKTTVPSAIIPMMPRPSAKLGYHNGSLGTTSENTIGPANLMRPCGLPPRLWICARSGD